VNIISAGLLELFISKRSKSVLKEEEEEEEETFLERHGKF